MTKRVSVERVDLVRRDIYGLKHRRVAENILIDERERILADIEAPDGGQTSEEDRLEATELVERNVEP